MIKKTIKKVRTRVHADLNKEILKLQKEIDELRHSSHRTELMTMELKARGTISVSESEIIAKIYSGLLFYLDPRDIAVVPHLAFDGIWEPEITKAWMTVLRSTDTVLDIGANFGYFGILAAQVVDPKKSKVIMFEANKNLLYYINKTTKTNWLVDRVVVENLAVSDKNNNVTLNVLKDYIGSSSVQTEEELSKYAGGRMNIEVQEKLKVKAVRIDDYCSEKSIKKVDLIKMDIEGFEENAYEGMRKTIKNSPEVTMFMEFTKNAYKDPKKFYQVLLNDFGNVYTTDSEGKIIKPKNTSYSSVVGWNEINTMPIFSKRKNLDRI